MELALEPCLFCPHLWVVTTSPAYLQSLWSNASVCGSPEVWLCTFFPSSSLQSPLVFSSERDESAIYRLYWTGTTCLFSFCNVLFSSIQLHFLHALSFLIDSLIKFYSIFSPISQKAISKFIWTLRCGNIVLGSKVTSFLYHFLSRISVQMGILPILNTHFPYCLSNSQHPWLSSCLLCLFTSFTTEQGGLSFTTH